MVRLLTLAWLACLTAALWLAALTPPAAGYELSLMDAYPPGFWALTVGASACSAGLLLLLAAREQRSGWWASGAAGVMATNAFILSLPLFRGYVVGDRADALNHIGYTRDILTSGTLSQFDFYPGMHFLQAAIELVGGTTPGQALVLINLLFSLLWTLGICVLVHQLAGDMRAVYLAAAFSAPFALLIYHTVALPSILSVMLLPVLFGLHLRRSSVAGWDRVLTIVVEMLVALLIVYLHPVTTLYAIFLMLSFDLAGVIYARIVRRSGGAAVGGEQPQQMAGIVGIMGISFLTWSFSFSVVTKNFAKVVLWLLGEYDRDSAIGEALGLVQIAQLPLIDLARILLNSFGVTIAITGAACLIVMLLIVYSMRQRRLPPQAYMTFTGMFLMAFMITAVMFLTSSSERHPIRLLRAPAILSLCALAWWGWEGLFRRSGSAHWPALCPARRRQLIGVAGGALVALIGAAQLNVYPHPRNGQPNAQVTASDVSGMAWLISKRTEGFRQASVVPEYVPRYESFFLGYAGFRSSRPGWWEPEIWLPSHFYADGWQCIAEVAPGERTYLALSDVGRLAPLRFPASIRHLAHEYTAQDEQRLAEDRSVSKLYDNGSFAVWMTSKEARACR